MTPVVWDNAAAQMSIAVTRVLLVEPDPAAQNRIESLLTVYAAGRYVGIVPIERLVAALAA